MRSGAAVLGGQGAERHCCSTGSTAVPLQQYMHLSGAGSTIMRLLQTMDSNSPRPSGVYVLLQWQFRPDPVVLQQYRQAVQLCMILTWTAYVQHFPAPLLCMPASFGLMHVLLRLSCSEYTVICQIPSACQLKLAPNHSVPVCSCAAQALPPTPSLTPGAPGSSALQPAHTIEPSWRTPR